MRPVDEAEETPTWLCGERACRCDELGLRHRPEGDGEVGWGGVGLGGMGWDEMRWGGVERGGAG